MYEIFISYASEDRVLAEKLFNSLNNRYFRVFYDQDALQAGKQWTPQLKAAVENSNHLVVLWSSNSFKAQWVWEEINTFLAKKNHGLLICVCLDVDNEVYNQFQNIQELLKAGVYPNGINNIDPSLWSSVVNTILHSVYQANNSKPIKRVVFTLTDQRLRQLNVPGLDVSIISNNYGPNFSDWKPFGNPKNIVEILDDYLYGSIDAEIKRKGTTFHWEDLDWQSADSKLWLPSRGPNGIIDQNVDIVFAEMQKLIDDPCVIVLDPFALNDPLIKDRFSTAFRKSSVNSKCVVMALNPCKLSEDLANMRRLLKAEAEALYENYFTPQIVDYTTLANCYANTLDDLEILRNIKMSLRAQVSAIDNSIAKSIIPNNLP